MTPTPEQSLRLVLDVARRAAGDDATAGEPAELLAALAELHSLRDLLTELEPRLIAVAREHGVSWAALADVLGVASRQAAEQRFLRLRPAEPDTATPPGATTGPATADQRVQAVRDRRAADRAVAVWAKENSALLRRLAGHVSSLADLTDTAQHSADLENSVDLKNRVAVRHSGRGDDDPASLLGPLAGAAPHVASTHPALAQQINDVTATINELRRQTQDRRTRP